jgi:hypothetical protein
MMAEIDDKNSAAAQKLSWEALRKSLNGLINKVGTGGKHRPRAQPARCSSSIMLTAKPSCYIVRK